MIPTEITLEQQQENGPYVLCRGGVGLNCPHFAPPIQLIEMLAPDTNLMTPGQKPAPRQHITSYQMQCGSHCALFDLGPHADERLDVNLLCGMIFSNYTIKPFTPAPETKLTKSW